MEKGAKGEASDAQKGVFFDRLRDRRERRASTQLVKRTSERSKEGKGERAVPSGNSSPDKGTSKT